MSTWWQSEWGLSFLFTVNVLLLGWCLRTGRKLGTGQRPWKWWVISGIALLSALEIQWLFWRVAGLLGMVSVGLVGGRAPGWYGILLWAAIAHCGLLVGFMLVLWRTLRRAMMRRTTTPS